MSLSDAAGLALSGRRILVTRSTHQAGMLSERLRALGAEPVEVPVLEIRPPESFAALDAALRRLGEYDWLILTSANAVRAFAGRIAEQGIAPAQPAKLNIAAVGSATAEAAHRAGFNIALMPEAYVAESLVAALKEGIAGEGISGRRVLLARAAMARDVIPDGLRQAGAIVDVADAYRNVLPEAAPVLLREALETRIDAVTFTSSSSATHLAEAARRACIPFPFAGVAAISIGPITSQTLRELGWEPAAEASPSEIMALVGAVKRALQNARQGQNT